MMNGEIKVKSKINQGTKFSVILPFSKINEYELPLEVVEPKIEPMPEITLDFKIKVLLAEDNRINQILVQKVLFKHKIECVTVGNGKLAVEAMENDDFDIILMDIMMPIMDGYEATALIRKFDNKVKNSIPIIALTATADAARGRDDRHDRLGRLEPRLHRQRGLPAAGRVGARGRGAGARAGRPERAIDRRRSGVGGARASGAGPGRGGVGGHRAVVDRRCGDRGRRGDGVGGHVDVAVVAAASANEVPPVERSDPGVRVGRGVRLAAVGSDRCRLRCRVPGRAVELRGSRAGVGMQ